MFHRKAGLIYKPLVLLRCSVSVGIGYVVEVEVEQACVCALVFHRQRHEFLFQIERDGGCIGIHREETASGLVVCQEEFFYRIR